MDKIFARAKSEGRGLVSNSHTKGYGVNSPAMAKTRALNKMKAKSGYKNNNKDDIGSGAALGHPNYKI